MEGFEIKGHSGFLNFEIKKVFGFPDKTSFLGGYDCIVNIEVEIPNYKANGEFYTSTGEIFEFYKKLSKAHKELKGGAKFINSEGSLELNIEYNIQGQVTVEGKYQKYLSNKNNLDFEIESDQSYINYTITDLKKIIEKYGNNSGVK